MVKKLKQAIVIVVIVLCCANFFIKSKYRVSIKIKEGTLTPIGATIIIKDNNYRTYTYGEWFQIEKEENGEWKKLEFLDDFWGGVFSTKCINVKKGNELQMEINWLNKYGELKKGKYRLLKKIDEELISVKFLID